MRNSPLFASFKQTSLEKDKVHPKLKSSNRKRDGTLLAHDKIKRPTNHFSDDLVVA